MGKKFGSFIVNFIMYILLGLVSVLLIARIFLSPYTMGKLVDIMFEEDEGAFLNLIDEESDSDFFNYVDKDDFNDELGVFLSDYLKYMGCVKDADKPSTDKLKKYFEEYMRGYAADNNVDLSEDDITEFLEAVDYELNDLLEDDFDEDVTLVFNIIYSNKLIGGFVFIVLGCIALNYAIRYDWYIVMRHCGIVAILNALPIVGLGRIILISKESGMGEVEKSMINLLGGNFLLYGIVVLVLGIGLILLSIYFKKKAQPVQLY